MSATSSISAKTVESLRLSSSTSTYGSPFFFGCLGIFMNLFRGEMLDKTLHFWFLMPVRREVLLAGKYVARTRGRRR